MSSTKRFPVYRSNQAKLNVLSEGVREEFKWRVKRPFVLPEWCYRKGGWGKKYHYVGLNGNYALDKG